MLFKTALSVAFAALAVAQSGDRRPNPGAPGPGRPSTCAVTSRTVTPSALRNQRPTPTVYTTSVCTTTTTVRTCTRTPTVTISNTRTVYTCTRTPTPRTVTVSQTSTETETSTVTISRTSITTATATPGVLGMYVFEDPRCQIPAVGRDRQNPEGELLLLGAPSRGEREGACQPFAAPISALVFQDYPDGLRLADRGCSFTVYNNGDCDDRNAQTVTIPLDGSREQTCQDPAGLDNMSSGRITCSRSFGPLDDEDDN